MVCELFGFIEDDKGLLKGMNARVCVGNVKAILEYLATRLLYIDVSIPKQ